MKPLVLAAALLACPALAQNLVPNPSFELLTSCPTTSDQLFLCVNWIKPTNGTTDYMNACHTLPIVGVPANVFGNQAARTGQAYAHIYGWTPGGSSYREYCQVKLTSPLAGGNLYEVSFWVSRADGANRAIGRLGAHLSVGAISSTNSFPLAVTPQVEHPDTPAIVDATNWVEIKGTFVAAGGEDHLTIGNFRDDTNTTTQSVIGSFQGATYYVDDVSVRSLSGPVFGSDHLIGWADLLVTSTTSFIDVQDTVGCPPAETICEPTQPVVSAIAHAGGTAYDPRYQSVWVSDGLLLAEYHLGLAARCKPRCPPFKPFLLDAQAVVSGLACADRQPRLFQLATRPGYMEIVTYDNRGPCPVQPKGCARALPPNAVAAGLAYDEVSDLLYVSVSSQPSANVWTTLLWVMIAASPCQPICEARIFTCGETLVTGLAHDACRRRLYATDGQVTQLIQIVEPRLCRVELGPCCKKQTKPIWRGLDIVPGWQQGLSGVACAGSPCPKCPQMIATTSGDPGLGNTFGLGLQNAPGSAFGVLFLKAGPCGTGIPLPLPFCGTWYAFPSFFSYPAVVLAGPSPCGGSYQWSLPIPPNRQLCGLPLCAQWFLFCVVQNKFGLGVSQALEFTIAGS